MAIFNRENYFSKYFELLSKNISSLDALQLQKASRMILETHQVQNKIIVVGNGGSAALASHVAVDLTKTSGIRAINFNESDLLTCFANDFGYEYWVAKALEFYADTGDLVILISSSGKSPNMIKGATHAKTMGLATITLSGFNVDNPLRKLGDLNLWADSTIYNIVETTHQAWLLAIIDYLIETEALAH